METEYLLLAQAPAEAPGLVEQPAAEEHAEEGTPEWLIELWLVLSLAIMIAIIWRPAKRAILGMLDGRALRIRDQLDEARKLREDAQTALADFQRKHRDALDEAQAIIDHARSEAARLRAAAAAELEQLLDRRAKAAVERIAQAEAQAVAQIRGLAVDVAVAATRTVIADRLDPQRAHTLVDQAIEELPAKLH